jgi:hypothetical protein
MKIIDKRHDYYDSVLISDEPVWIRTEIEEKDGDMKNILGSSFVSFFKDLQELVPRGAPFIKNVSGRSHRNADINTILISFCGEFYAMYSYKPVLDLVDLPSFDTIYASSPLEMVKLQNALAVSCNQKNRCIELGKGSSWFGAPFSEPAHIRLLEFLKRYSDISESINQKFETPVISIELGRSIFKVEMSGAKIFVNPLLSKYKFERVISPWEAAQRIERYLSNDLVKEPLNDFKMSDLLKRDSKGMDKWSFKQRGPKKRKIKKGE